MSEKNYDLERIYRGILKVNHAGLCRFAVACREAFMGLPPNAGWVNDKHEWIAILHTAANILSDEEEHRNTEDD